MLIARKLRVSASRQALQRWRCRSHRPQSARFSAAPSLATVPSTSSSSQVHLPSSASPAHPLALSSAELGSPSSSSSHTKAAELSSSSNNSDAQQAEVSDATSSGTGTRGDASSTTSESSSSSPASPASSNSPKDRSTRARKPRWSAARKSISKSKESESILKQADENSVSEPGDRTSISEQHEETSVSQQRDKRVSRGERRAAERRNRKQLARSGSGSGVSQASPFLESPKRSSRSSRSSIADTNDKAFKRRRKSTPAEDAATEDSAKGAGGAESSWKALPMSELKSKISLRGSDRPLECYATCGIGAESFLSTEIRKLLKGKRVRARAGQVHFSVDNMEQLIDVAHRTRTAESHYIQLGFYECLDFPDLHKFVKMIKWNEILRPNSIPNIRCESVNNRNSFFADPTLTRVQQWIAQETQVKAKKNATKGVESNEGSASLLPGVKIEDVPGLSHAELVMSLKLVNKTTDGNIDELRRRLRRVLVNAKRDAELGASRSTVDIVAPRKTTFSKLKRIPKEFLSPDEHVECFVRYDKASIAIRAIDDTHKRGYMDAELLRRNSHESPALANILLKASKILELDPHPVWIPFGGHGVLAVEAALALLHASPFQCDSKVVSSVNLSRKYTSWDIFDSAAHDESLRKIFEEKPFAPKKEKASVASKKKDAPSKKKKWKFLVDIPNIHRHKAALSNIEAASALNTRSAPVSDMISVHQNRMGLSQDNVPEGASVLSLLPTRSTPDAWQQDMFVIEELGRVLRKRPDIKRAYVMTDNLNFTRYSKMCWNRVASVDCAQTRTTFDIFKLDRYISAAVSGKKRELRREKNFFRQGELRREIEELTRRLKE